MFIFGIDSPWMIYCFVEFTFNSRAKYLGKFEFHQNISNDRISKLYIRSSRCWWHTNLKVFFFFIVYNTLIMSVLDHVRPFCEWIFEWHFPPHSEIDLYIQEIISLFYVSFVIYAFVIVITLYEQTELMVKLSSGRKVFMTSLMIPNV